MDTEVFVSGATRDIILQFSWDTTVPHSRQKLGGVGAKNAITVTFVPENEEESRTPMMLYADILVLHWTAFTSYV